MNENLLTALTQLFAYIVLSLKMKEYRGRSTFIGFLETKDYQDEQIEQIVHRYDDYYELLEGSLKKQQFNRHLNKLTSGVNVQFEDHQKMWLLLQLSEFAGNISERKEEFLPTLLELAEEFKLDKEELRYGVQFIVEKEEKLPHTENLLLVAAHNTLENTPCKYLQNNKIKGRVYVFRIESTNTYLMKYFGIEDGNIFLNGRAIEENTSYLFGLGTVIRGALIDPIYYNKVINTFNYDEEFPQLEYIATNISYRFVGSKDGIAPFDFHAKTGELVAIMGGSGVGKSTLLNLLNGSLKSRKGGKITINGLDLEEDKEELKGVIGYVPQDDLLVEELTVKENLKYGARLCFKDYSKQQIEELVADTIEKFDLVEAQNLKVGNPLNKFISGGQRKRLNIAMEVMRSPYILFIDEPTSGLSSIDSEKIMFMLKRQSIEGRLIIVNIHQPSSDIFKLFNRILIVDQGGKVIFQGNPMDAIRYFKHEGNLPNLSEDECSHCGAINTDVILKVVESRIVNEYGKLTRVRKRSAREWYNLYNKNIKPLIYKTPSIFNPIPKNNFQIPSRIKQLIIFLQRTVKSKIADTQYLLVTMLTAPILACILGYFTKFVAGTPENPSQYLYSENANIPSYLLMCVIAVLFCGLSSSAEQIVRDRKVRQREKFLNLSRNAYLLSKVLFLLLVSAIQSFAFTWIGNTILEIETGFWIFWSILFSSAVCANMLGLNISAALKSEAAIYILIPVILVPQILLSGMVVSYDKLHPSIDGVNRVPLVGNAAISRWSFEALSVAQYRYNNYEKPFFEDNMKISQFSYWTTYFLPILDNKLARLENTVSASPEYKAEWLLIRKSFRTLTKSSFCCKNKEIHEIAQQVERQHNIPFIRAKLDSLREELLERTKTLRDIRSNNLVILAQKMGGEKALQTFRQKNTNEALSNLVLAKNEIDKIKEYNNMLVQYKDPIYKEPIYTNGQAHFYAPYKRLGDWKIDTVVFNIVFLWVLTIVGYVFLYFNILYKVVSWINVIQILRVAKRFARITPR